MIATVHLSLQVPPSLQVQPRKIQLNEYIIREIASIFTKQLQENLTRPKSLFEQQQGNLTSQASLFKQHNKHGYYPSTQQRSIINFNNEYQLIQRSGLGTLDINKINY